MCFYSTILCVCLYALSPGVKGLPDCILYESQAIVEWCDEVPWPSHCLLHDNGNGDAPVPPGPLPTEKAKLLYPASPEVSAHFISTATQLLFADATQ